MIDFIVFILFLILFLILVVSLARKSREEYHSNWGHLLPNFKFSTKDFYTLFKHELESHDIEGLKFFEAHLKTGSIISSSRLDFHYDLCFAPFGDGCFVSWWLIYDISAEEEFFSKLPLVGGWIQRAFYRTTFYKVDTASMFMTYAHRSVLKVIDDITQQAGVRIEWEDRKPKLNDIFKR